MGTKLPLADIRGLDSISFWPLAIGWWFVIGLALVMLLGVIAAIILRARQRRSWRAQALGELKTLEAQLSVENAKSTALALALLIRRLAMQRFSREQVAALQGQAWLKWLQDSDPQKFAWAKARFLTEAPYCRENKMFDPSEIRDALRAAKGWVR